MKKEKLLKQIKQLEKDNADLKNELESGKEATIRLETQVNDQASKLEQSEAEVSKLKEEIAKLENEKEGLSGEKVFLAQVN